MSTTPFAGMPFEVAVLTAFDVLISLRKHPLHSLQPCDLRDLRSFTSSQQSQLLDYLLLEEALRLLQDVCRQFSSDTAQMYTAVLLAEKLPLRSMPPEWLPVFARFADECRKWVVYLDLWNWDWTPEQLDQIPPDGLAGGWDGKWRFTKQLNMHWTPEALNEWTAAWNMVFDQELVGKVYHATGDPGFVLTHRETKLKILLSFDPDFVIKIARASRGQQQDEHVEGQSESLFKASTRVARGRGRIGRPTQNDLVLDKQLQALTGKSDYLKCYSGKELFKRCRKHLSEWGFSLEYSGFRNRILRLKKVLRVQQ